MTEAEKAKLEGRLLANELAVQALLTIIVQYLPAGPEVVRHSLDNLLLALEQIRALGTPKAAAEIDSARARVEQLRSRIEKLPTMRQTPSGEPAP